MTQRTKEVIEALDKIDEELKEAKKIVEEQNEIIEPSEGRGLWS